MRNSWGGLPDLCRRRGGANTTTLEEAGEGNVNLSEKQEWAQRKITGSYEWNTTYFRYSDPLNDGEVLDSAPPIRFESKLTEEACRKPSMLFVTSKRSKQPEAAAQIVNCTLTEPSSIDALRDTRGLPAEKCAADRLIDAGLIKPEIVRAHEPPMQASGTAISPFKEPPELRVAFIDALKE